MTMASPPVDPLLSTVKSREVQRALLAEMRGDAEAAPRHFLAAAHLELVLAEDYRQAGEDELALRSRLSAASCFWRGGQRPQAERLFETLLQAYPAQAIAIEQVRAELTRDYP
jgi:hypothetical protein